MGQRRGRLRRRGPSGQDRGLSGQETWGAPVRGFWTFVRFGVSQEQASGFGTLSSPARGLGSLSWVIWSFWGCYV